MSDSPLYARIALSLLLCLPAAAPATARIWEGAGASPGGAIAAKAIGQYCPGVLSRPEIDELDAYLAKDASEQRKKDDEATQRDSGYKPFAFEEFRRNFAAHMVEKYSNAKNCDADSAEEARDMLQRIRKLLATGSPA
jgi:hypothetical protein